jgi:hypothetical protein
MLEGSQHTSPERKAMDDHGNGGVALTAGFLRDGAPVAF